MDDCTSIANDELARLKNLASTLLAGETAELPLLESMASLAGEIAARCRDDARRRSLAVIAEAAAALFAPPIDDPASRLADRSLDELTSLEQLLGAAGTTRQAFAEADQALMAAHERGDFAAMAPLALEADRQKSALAASVAQFASRTGIDASVRAEPLDMPAAAPEASALLVDTSPPAQPAASPAEVQAEAERHPPSPERRRIRDLIRQVRPVADEAA
ncbi:MAG TPA: hypothetical protein VMF86_05010 [Stellaceae bacterium]|nr:hypothetical protein [Stellaceae bacterium]